MSDIALKGADGRQAPQEPLLNDRPTGVAAVRDGGLVFQHPPLLGREVEMTVNGPTTSPLAIVPPITVNAAAANRAAPARPLPDLDHVVRMVSPTSRNGGYEAITVESTIPFPSYDDLRTWQTDGATYLVKPFPPLIGTFAHVYRNGTSAVFEVDLEMDNDYFRNIVYYPDVTNPVPHLYAKFGPGAHFKEFAVDPSYKPRDLFPGS